jgi:hypothetical protein
VDLNRTPADFHRLQARRAECARQLEMLSGPDRKYVSSEDSTFLRVCRLGEHDFIGKVIHERFTTERVDDVRGTC